MLTGQVAAPGAVLSPISVPLAELFNVALEYERAGRLADADRTLGHVLAEAPTQADALHLMQRSMRHGVNTPLYWHNIGEVLRVLGKLDEMLAAGRQAVSHAGGRSTSGATSWKVPA